ncbi:MAG: M48 family metallopeptidase [Nitrosomonas sp.]|jgi:predicted metal-dependent hydrolase|nr:M48 family metallopeptidase [Nitrosomonas sp.]
MNIDSQFITVSDIPVEIVRKKIKNIHLGVYPPEGSVRVSVPQHITNENVRLAIVSRLPWIKKRQEEFKKQPRQTEREYVSGESHYYQGKRYILDVIERHGKHALSLKNNAKMILSVSPGTTKENRALVVNAWYRQQLKIQIPQLLAKWQPIVGKEISDWGVKKMKTKWGSCNIAERRIWINLELAKKSPECLEYILVHELVHLHERHHNDNFRSLMDRFLPNWRQSRDFLKSEPLAHEDWGY